MESSESCPSSQRLSGTAVATLHDAVSNLAVHSWKRSQSIDSGFIFDLDSIHENVLESAPDDSSSSLDHVNTHARLTIHQEDTEDDRNDTIEGTSLSRMFSSMESFGLVPKNDSHKLSSRVTSLDSLDSSLSLGEHFPESPIVMSNDDQIKHINEISKNFHSVCIKKIDRLTECDECVVNSSKQPVAKQSWLLRLFESKLFDMSIAIQYLFNSKEPGVQAYIGKISGLH